MKYFTVLFSTLVVTAHAFYDFKIKLTKPEVDLWFLDHDVFLSFALCFVDKAPCTGLPKTIKDILPEAVEEACAKCSPVQKYGAKTFHKKLETFPEYNEEFKKKFDPEHKYFDSFKAAIADS